ncbi:salivary C-type lectin 2-like [Rhynchophorus ferrugineus]|uniref:C-type lectin domain-containing protein n=1 Tax=Rhynchophorus ferrugineus TaxID=354439 RepID=A0A834MFD8_RHYFE|nr:hypothetical protein GWI33_004554 [Rhynchophorus ferrugineus]
MMSKLFLVALMAISLKGSTAASANFTMIRLPSRLGATSYLLSSETANFFQAFVSCQESDMNLAAITTEVEASNLDFALRNTAKDGDSFWMSGSNLPDVETKQYYWFTGGKRAVYTDWLPGEPNDEEGVEHCLGWEQREGVGVGWNDFECTLEKKYICQY